MPSAFPGRPQPRPQALDTVVWDGRRVIAYISRNALIIYEGPQQLVQTISSHDDKDEYLCLSIDPSNGKIAVASRKKFQIYKPSGHEYGARKTNYGDLIQWSLQSEQLWLGDEEIDCLSWGLQDELLLGGSSLWLFDTSQARGQVPVPVWARSIANPVTTALFSHDASLIATTGQYDHLVKIWRRSFGGEHERLDTVYLAHPAAVTSLEWRGRPDQDTHLCSVLYTGCADGKLRIWTDRDHHCVTILSLWGEVDLGLCIQPRDVPALANQSNRFFFIINHWHLKKHLETSDRDLTAGDRTRHLRHDLREIAQMDAEVCVVTDNHGHLSAWALEGIGHGERTTSNVLNIAYAENVDLKIPTGELPEDNYALIKGIFSEDASELHILTQAFNGRVDWHTGYIDELFDPAPVEQRLAYRGAWTGHGSAIEKIVTNSSKTRLAVVTRGLELIVWRCESRIASMSSDADLAQECIIDLESLASDAWFTDNDESLVTRHGNHVAIWDVTVPRGRLVGKNDASDDEAQQRKRDAAEDSMARSVESHDSVGEDQDQRIVDWKSATELTLTCNGVLRSANAGSGKVETTLVTGIEGATLYMAAPHYAILISQDHMSLTIWNMTHGTLEHKQQFPPHESIDALDWVVTPTGESLIALALSRQVAILGQSRAESDVGAPAWIELCRVVSPETSFLVTNLAWLSTGNLVSATHTQLFVNGRSQRVRSMSSERSGDFFSLVTLLNKSLPSYHPVILEQLMLAGKGRVIQHILVYLAQSVKFLAVGDNVDALLGIHSAAFLQDSSPMEGDALASILGNNHGPLASDDVEEISHDDLLRDLESTMLPHFSRKEQAGLQQLVGVFAALRSVDASLDEYARPFLAAYYRHRSKKEADPRADLRLSWREIVWARQSTCQEILVDLTTSHLQSKLLWSDAKATGMFMWMTDLGALKAQFEVVARTEYGKTEDRNPVDCSLFYLALKKKSTLIGLWRLAAGNKERGATLKLLANDFDDARWKTAALKNAYALLGRRRTEYAAAFFLLADRLKDAVGILENQLQDLQLAVAVARVYEGDDGPVLRELLQDKVLPRAASEGNRWLASWAYGMLGREEDALRALYAPLADFVSQAAEPSQSAYGFTNEDPLRAYTYRLQRDKSRADPRRASLAASRGEEYTMVRQCASMFARKGCHIMAMDLVCNWRFTTGDSAGQGSSNNRLTVVDRTKTAPVEHEEHTSGAVSMMNGQPRKVVTAEPSASSILDSFDF